MEDPKLVDLASIYQVDFCRLSFHGMEDYNRENVFDRAYHLLTNQHVRSLLLGSKETVFSRPDTNKPEDRFQEAIYSIFRHAGYFDSLDSTDFSTLQGYLGMIKQLKTYKRKGDLMTTSSREVQEELTHIFNKYTEEMRQLQVRPSVYGSIRYGDASNSADIDINFLVSSNDDSAIISLVGDIEYVIDQELGIRKRIGNDLLVGHQITDYTDSSELIVDLSEMQAVLKDIIEGETTCLDDYLFKEQYFYPYNWIIEGKSYSRPLDRIDAETKLTRRMIGEAVKKDPFFQFLVCFGLGVSIKKRKDNKKRI
tara:strand:+ start:16 stop:945 length:930 start_codon:yes stop_codon:yes gene_type:complete